MESSSESEIAILTDRILHEILTKITALVGKGSTTDLFNFKLTSKYIRQCCEDEVVFQNASMDRFSKGQWTGQPSATVFFQRCFYSCNHEALFTIGMLMLFTHLDCEKAYNF